MGMRPFGGWNRMHFNEEDLVKPEITWPFIKRILKYFVPYWKQMLAVFAAISAAAALGLVPPLLTRSIIDKALPGKDMQMLTFMILASFGATVLLNLFNVMQNYLNTWISRHIIYDMKNSMFKHLQYMSTAFFSTAKPGEIMTRMTSDISGIQSVVNDTVVNLLRNIVVLAVTAAALFNMNWKLSVVGMIIIPLFIFPTRKVGKVRWKIALETQQKTSELNQLIQEILSISGSTLMKLFTKEKAEYASFSKTNLESANLQIREAMAGRWFRMIMEIFTTMGPMIIYFYGGYLFIKGELTIGSIIAFVALLGRLYGPVTQLSNIHVDITRSMALFQRIFEYFDKEQEIRDRENASLIDDVRGDIEFRNVSFSYNEGVEVLKDISFRIEPGRMLALVGPSGAGKTTITSLIPRLYDYRKGNIYLDGRDIKDISLESLRSRIGVVTQDTYLFNDTIWKNLIYAKESTTREEIEEACKAAYIHDFIMTLPDRYDTVVGNRGIKLSGGEKQRISIARVILKDPSIIILDEATSSLDSVSESLIQKALVPLLCNRTSIVIAHRLSTIMAADRILVIDNGVVAESGKHEELLSKSRIYRNLYEKQFKVNGKETEATGI